MEIKSHYHVLVAGGGVAGALAAVRLARANPHWNILLAEKEPYLGGRLCTSEDNWSHGLNSIGQPLHQYWDQTIKDDPEALDLPEFTEGRIDSVGVLSKGELRTLPARELFAASGAKTLGGRVAAKDWTKVDDAFGSEEEVSKQGFNQVFAGGRKSASAAVLERLAFGIGIPDIWSANLEAMTSRVGAFASERLTGNWTAAIDTLLDGVRDQIDVAVNCRVLSATRSDSAWQVETQKGELITDKIVVAQSPWEALLWLPKQEWPPELLNIATKSKPVSVVTLSVSLTDTEPSEDSSPDVSWVVVPTEDVQAHIDQERKQLVLQATLDYELSLQAPAVVKAVRRLKRAKNKVAKVCSLKLAESDHLALLPVGWAQSPAQADRRYVDKMGKIKLNSEDLSFCGDAYGGSYDGDANILSSVPNVVESFSGASEAEA